jgi:hypothetical protein
MRVSYTLLADGTSDRALMRVIGWTLRHQGASIERESWADLRPVPRKPQTLTDRVQATLRLYPCDILFVHRDAENQALDERVSQISAAVATVSNTHVPVVPVRMTEAWFLHDEGAIRQASGNPNGNVALSVPAPAQVEQLADPKATLFAALLSATELTGRKRAKKKKELPRMRARVAELIDDFAPLAQVPAFARFSDEVARALRETRQR